MRLPAAALGILAAVLVATPEGEAQAPRRTSVLGNEPFLLVADEVQYDEDLGLTVAKGHVEISQDKQIVLADTVTYNQKTDTLTASGHVSLLEPTGDVLFGDFIELHDQLKNGFIKDVRALLSDRSRIAGNTARWFAGTRTEVRRGVYSPCDLCAKDPTHPPLWQIKAAEIIHDKPQQVVEFRDAVFQLDGIPAFYTPYFSLPDPTAKRVSGFLAPTFGHTTSLGYHTSTPYYWVIGPDKDATIEPLVTTQAGAVLHTEYRERWGNGALDVNASGAYTDRQDNVTGNSISGIDAFRGHVYAKGEFDIDQDWRSTLLLNRSTDQTYLRRFHFGDGALPFLESRASTEGFDDRSYTVFDSYMFQSQQSTIGDATQPGVLPSATYSWISHPDSSGERWSVGGNALNLFRPDGTDIRRVSTNGGWSLPFDGLIGDRFILTANLRGDAYYSDEVALTAAEPANQTEVAGRIFPQAKLEWHYPWVRHGTHDSETIEPIVALIGSPNGGNPATIPNEDSQGFEFDETSLFALDRFPGYDRIDSGQRVDYGIRAAIYGDHGGNTRLLVGQSRRLASNSPFTVGSGVEHRTSDVVGRLSVSPGPYLDLIYRFRLNHDDLAAKRQEVTASLGPPSFRVNLNLISISGDPQITDFQALRQVSGSVTMDLTRYWSATVFGTQNIGSVVTQAATASTNPAIAEVPLTLASGVALSYHDECITLTGSFAHSGTHDRDVLPGTTVLFTIVFKSIGGFNVPIYSTGTNAPVAPVL